MEEKLRDGALSVELLQEDIEEAEEEGYQNTNPNLATESNMVQDRIILAESIPLN